MTIDSTQAKWDFCKYEIRKAAIQYGKQRSKETRKEKERAEKDYAKALEANMDEKERAEIQERLRKIYEAENDVIRFCRGLDFIEMGEKITPFFFRTIGKSQML